MIGKDHLEVIRTFKLEIHMVGPAMAELTDLGDALVDVGDRVRLDQRTEGVVQDRDGNTVGEYEIVEEAHDEEG